MTDRGSIYEGIPADLPEELFETLCAAGNVRIERIVSRGHASPPGFWYDQKENEFVLVVKGSAGLMFEDTGKTAVLKAGDYVNIPAGVRHRVAWTDPDGDTVWLAVFY
jgi:cupin 2 domain-containing protein